MKTLGFKHLRTAALSALTALALFACGGSGTVPATGVAATGGGIRPLSAEFSTRKAVAYSPFRSTNRDTETITAAMIKQDLDLLIAGGFKLIRMFDSSDAVTKLTLQVIQSNGLDMKMLLGMYVSGSRGSNGAPIIPEAQNQAELARGIALAKTYPSTVLAVSIGNETMVSWSFVPVPPATMAGYIKSVRNQITQPVTTDDNWAFFANADRAVLNEIDFAAVHTYPLADSVHTPGHWDWQQVASPAASRAVAMMDAAIASAKRDIAAVRSNLDLKGFNTMPIVVGETGWKAVNTGDVEGRAHPVNHKMYFDRLNAWNAAPKTAAMPVNVFYFEAFDEPWKQSDDKWALFNVNRQARYAIQSLYPAATWEAGTYTAADAVYHIPVVANSRITANRYTAYSDVTTAGEAKPTETPIWNAWDSGVTASYPEITSDSAPTDMGKSIEITPKPSSGNWGWGLALQLPLTAEDMSNFTTSTGKLNFSIKTTYPGKIEIGFFTGTVSASTGYDVYLPISPGEYGYDNNGAWHLVSIPISAITPKGAKAFGNSSSPTAVLDMSKVTAPFVIADRYAATGKPTGANFTNKIYVDGVYWSK
jgi:exo-beta-1,3-glucanase (GH17 family)